MFEKNFIFQIGGEYWRQISPILMEILVRNIGFIEKSRFEPMFDWTQLRNHLYRIPSLHYSVFMGITVGTTGCTKVGVIRSQIDSILGAIKGEFSIQILL